MNLSFIVVPMWLYRIIRSLSSAIGLVCESVVVWVFSQLQLVHSCIVSCDMIMITQKKILISIKKYLKIKKITITYSKIHSNTIIV